MAQDMQEMQDAQDIQELQTIPETSTNQSRHRLFFIIIAIALVLAGGIGIFFFTRKPAESDTLAPDAVPRDNTPYILVPEASGEVLDQTDVMTLDRSNLSEGYLILTYLGTNEKVKFQIEAPDEVTYTYLIPGRDIDIVLPLTGGDGTYRFRLLESVDIENDRYAIVYNGEAPVTLSNEFLPYLTPNLYVTYTSSSNVVSLGQELSADCYCDLDVIEHIYNYVIGTIAYDTEKAQSVAYGYLPDPDQTLEQQTGICFDYASLMTAMLRTQKIPTKLQVGYAGDAYHAWISCYVEEIGWVNNIIEFDGEHWSLMDPTLAANNSDEAVAEYIGDGSTYLVKYTY